MAFDIYEAVTARIIEQLERGKIPWSKPWTGLQSGAVSGITGKPYSLLNQMLLGKPGPWYTFNQVQSLGGKVRKGEKASMVVFWKQQKIREADPATGEQTEKLIPLLKYYNVFHISQVDGIETAGSLRNSAAYIQSWLRALRNDKKLIVTASGAAAKAFDMITGSGASAPVA
jgi:antirestriction protein ArdC